VQQKDSVKIFCAHDAMVAVEKIVPNPRNPNQHPEAQINLLARIIEAQGWRAPITVSNRSGFIVRGHGRLAAAQRLGLAECPVDFQDYASEAEEWADLIADNRLAELAVMDEGALAGLLDELSRAEDFDATLAGFTNEQIEALLAPTDADTPADRQAAGQSLSERFLIPPFSILDARAAAWQERKGAWKRLGIKSEIGRGNDGDKAARGGLTFNLSSQPISTYRAKNELERDLGEKMTWDEFARLCPYEIMQCGTSIFDPVLCELAYRWFCPPGGRVLDPFAGGSVRGIVAAALGRSYFGVDLSARQIEANRQNWAEVVPALPGCPPEPSWVSGNSVNIQNLAGRGYDFLFSCPPYVDLEKYSDNPDDLSNKPYPEFLSLYRQIIHSAAAILTPDRFACFVVGEVRAKGGEYYNFVGDTVKAFLDAGLAYYNEAILISAAGSLVVRVGKQFSNSRKLGKTHQNVLVFCKGDLKKAVAALGDIDTAEIFGDVG
jgi:ParB-like chromosome segregation protein Spo0J